VYDDYGHHPTEIRIRCDHQGAECPKRLICVFQTTSTAGRGFLLSNLRLSSADVVIVPHIYFVRFAESANQRIGFG
jgi:UDP-N-acetylmuramate-alanine ligase